MRKVLRVLRYAGLLLLGTLVGIVAWANIQITRDEVTPASHGAPGRFIKAGGHDWHVVTQGELHSPGEVPILLIHGFTATGGLMWKPVTARIGAQRALIIPDVLGYGHSQHITTPGPYYSLTDYAASISAILAELGVGQVDVIGHSYGGAIAARFAIDHPQRVRRIIFIDAAVYYEKTVADSLTRWPLGIGPAVTWAVTGAGPLSGATRFCGILKKNSEECSHLFRAKDNNATTRAMMYTYHHTSDPTVLITDLPRIVSPSLVIWGSNDRLFPATHGKRLADTLKAPLVLVPGGYHAPHLYKQTEVVGTMLKFLSQP